MYRIITKNLIFAVAAFAFFISPSFSNISANDSSASCDNSTIGASSGTTTLEAQWQANTITLKWYNDGEQFTPTNSSAAGECTYDQAMTLPSNTLSKEGYTFDGWTVKAAAVQCDFSGLSDTTTNGEVVGYTRLDGGVGGKEAEYGLTQGSGEWAAEFEHGIVKGVASCNNTSGDTHGNQWNGNTSDWSRSGDIFNTSSTGGYCWCKMTSYIPKPWIYDTGDAGSSPIYLTGYTNKTNCKVAIRAITGLNSTNANTLLNNASGENPQLITNATGANLAYLTDLGCTTSGAAAGHFGECSSILASDSLWVYVTVYGTNCASKCASGCAIDVRDKSAFRAALYGGIQ